MKLKSVVFQRTWERKSPLQLVQPVYGGYLPLRPWQAEAFNILRDARHITLTAPPGAGKTKFMCGLAAHRLLHNPKLRALMVMPQTGIRFGFEENYIHLPTDQNIDWFAMLPERQNLCRPLRGTRLGDEQRDNRTKLRLLREFLCPQANEPQLIQGRWAMCTHALLRLAFREFPELFKDLLVFLDEAHHTRSTSTEDTLGVNNLGEFVNYVFVHPEAAIQLGMVSATPFRSDRFPTTPSQYREEFVDYFLPLDEYFDSCIYLKSFQYHVSCTSDPKYKTALREIFDGVEPHFKPTIFFIPPVNSRLACEKNDHVQYIYEVLTGTDTLTSDVIKDQDRPVTLVKYNGRWLRVINLVNPNPALREQRKKFIDEHSGDVDVIIALNVFTEGANWPEAARVIILGGRSSVPQVMQMIGRLWRDIPGKETVDVIQIIPAPSEAQSLSDEHVQGYIQTICLLLIVEDLISPPEGLLNGEKIKLTHLVGPQVLSDILGSVAIHFDSAMPREEFDDLTARVLAEHEANGHVKKEHRDFITQLLWKRFNDSFNGHMERATDRSERPGEADASPFGNDFCRWQLTHGSDKYYDAEKLRELRAAYYESNPHLYLSYSIAGAVCKRSGIRTEQEFYAWAERRNDIPVDPPKYYGNEFTSWPDFLQCFGNGPFVVFDPWTSERLLVRDLTEYSHSVSQRIPDLDREQFTEHLSRMISGTGADQQYRPTGSRISLRIRELKTKEEVRRLRDIELPRDDTDLRQYLRAEYLTNHRSISSLANELGRSMDFIRRSLGVQTIDSRQLTSEEILQ